jgi:hypothetical protein
MRDGPFEEGTDAYCRGSARSSCPYPPGSRSFAEWMRGWDDAQKIATDETYPKDENDPST